MRDYPQGELFGNPVGYDFIDQRTGIELSENDVLVGEKNEFASILEQLQGQTEKGSDLTVTLDAGAQRSPRTCSRPGPGSLVAIEPSTGAVRAMVSTPGFDPNTVDDPGVLKQLNTIPADEPSKLLNRATQGRYPPGSTMKVVTAAAALDSGEFEPDSIVNGDIRRRHLRGAAGTTSTQRLRRDHADRRAHELGQHCLGPGRRAARPGDDGRVHEALRLLRAARARLPADADDRVRPAHRTASSSRTASTSAASRSARAARRARCW